MPAMTRPISRSCATRAQWRKAETELSSRHGRACHGHPRLSMFAAEDVDARVKHGHDHRERHGGQESALMPKYRLHYFPESGNSYKLALMLTLCGETFEGVWTDFGGGATRTAEWRREVNPMGEIPVLEIDGKRFTQTAPILLTLAKQYGRFGGETEDEQFELLRWLFWDNHKLTGYMASYRYYRAFTSAPDEHVQKHFRRRLDDFLSILE